MTRFEKDVKIYSTVSGALSLFYDEKEMEWEIIIISISWQIFIFFQFLLKFKSLEEGTCKKPSAICELTNLADKTNFYFKILKLITLNIPSVVYAFLNGKEVSNIFSTT